MQRDGPPRGEWPGKEGGSKWPAKGEGGGGGEETGVVKPL